MVKQSCWVGTVLCIYKPLYNIGEGISLAFRSQTYFRLGNQNDAKEAPPYRGWGFLGIILMKKNHLGKKVIRKSKQNFRMEGLRKGLLASSQRITSLESHDFSRGRSQKNGTFDEFYAHPDKGYVKQYERYTPKGYGHFAVNEYGKTANGKTHHIRTLDKDAWA